MQLDSFEFNFHHFFSIWFDSLGSQSSQKSTKTIYAELFGLSKKVINCAFKADMRHELLNILKTFIYDAQNKMNNQETETETFFNINNLAIIKHKGRPPKRFKSNAEKSISKQGKQVLRDSTNVIEEETNETNSTMG